MTGNLRHDRQRDGITIINLDRPQARNALTLDMARRLTALLDEVDADPKAVLWCGTHVQRRPALPPE
ncbi:MAG TPA: enoyl-CoA hydratase/isomerase family protein [Sphingobium sp.]